MDLSCLVLTGDVGGFFFFGRPWTRVLLLTISIPLWPQCTMSESPDPASLNMTMSSETLVFKWPPQAPDLNPTTHFCM